MLKIIPVLLILIFLSLLTFYHLTTHINDDIHACGIQETGMNASPSLNRTCHCSGDIKTYGQDTLDGAIVQYCDGYGWSIDKKWPF